MIEILKSVIFGIVEGITEWLPISSTGHLILLGKFLHLDISENALLNAEYKSMFEVVIQLGAILAVAVLYFGRLNPFSRAKGPAERRGTWALWGKVALASIPAAVVGIVLDKLIEKLTGRDIDGWLFNWQVVAAALIVYGVLFILIEKLYKPSSEVRDAGDITWSKALLVGCFQALSILPGTSRSGSTILGARMLGISRPAAAEFSFFLGIPAICGAALIKGAGFVKFVADTGVGIPAHGIIALIVATAVSFGVSMLAIRFLMDFVKKHSFVPFGVYRIALGAAVILYFALRGA